MDKLLTMLELQNSLNNSTNGDGWVKGETKNGKKIDWLRCIYMEAFELIDSYPWKHWQNINAKVDRANIKIESVDIWHFVMSQALKETRLKGVSIKDLAKEIINKRYFQEYLKNSRKDYKSFYDEIVVVESLIKVTFDTNDIHKLLESFFEVANVAELSFDELYTLYIGKNTLNRFRQDNGYKNGNYSKNWRGKEDNEIMQEILDKTPNITPENLYGELKKRYEWLKQ